ncbi:DUF3761 domain-containing protein [Saccharopolyspora phatthalungensis]|uniref:DUF3761 domain-containing protein n=1 Tax=Saccharopolyspora phatthalungensis TaxID=664693 RepID=UPI00160D593D|nr:DUF3761 domain-containing protein [Saccharopolyspora phatthalungensis]
MNPVEPRGRTRAIHTSRSTRRPLSTVFSVLGAFLVSCVVLAGCQDRTAVPANPGIVPSPAVSAPAVASSALASPAPTTESPVPPVSSTESAPAAPVTTHAPVKPTQAAPTRATAGITKCGADYYRNVDGKCVHDPVKGAAPPAGATARCKDGSYSFSQHRRGTCSGHDGVAEWL